MIEFDRNSLTNQQLAEKISEIEKRMNQPMGVSCLRHIVFYLEKEDRTSAEIIAKTDCDKISQYPEAIIFIHENLTELGCYYEFAKKERN
jgi:hypothetical protein